MSRKDERLATLRTQIPEVTPEQAQAALTLLQKTSEATDAAAGILAPALRALTNRAAGATPRLYIHIAQESQREPQQAAMEIPARCTSVQAIRSSSAVGAFRPLSATTTAPP